MPMSAAAKQVILLRRGGGAPVPVISTASIPDAGVGVAYSTTLAADNTPTSWSVVVTDYDGTDITSGCGLSINSSGVLSGTPAIPAGSDGLWTVTVTATNAGGTSAPAVYTIEAWQLLVNFSTDDAAPISNPYNGEFGSLATVDSGNNVSVSSGTADLAAIVGVNTDPRLTYAVTAQENVAIVVKANFNGGNWSQGFAATETGANSPNLRNVGNTVFNQSDFRVSALPYPSDFIGVTCASGVQYTKLASGNFLASWPIANMSLSGTIYAKVHGVTATAGDVGIDYVRVIVLPSFMASTYPITTFNATSAFTDVRTGTADGVIVHEYTQPSPDAAADELSVIFRRQDASNYWQARIRRNAGDTNYDLIVDTVASGTPTNRLTVSNIGNTDALLIYTEGTTLRFATRSGTTWTARGSSLTLSLYSTQTGVTTSVVQGAWTQTRLVSVPLTDATVTAILDRVTA